MSSTRLTRALTYSGDVLGRRADKQGKVLMEAEADEKVLRTSLKTSRDVLRTKEADVRRLKDNPDRQAQVLAEIDRVKLAVTKLETACTAANQRARMLRDEVSNLVSQQQGMYDEAERLSRLSGCLPEKQADLEVV